jgi:hypothetical protein
MRRIWVQMDPAVAVTGSSLISSSLIWSSGSKDDPSRAGEGRAMEKGGGESQHSSLMGHGNSGSATPLPVWQVSLVKQGKPYVMFGDGQICKVGHAGPASEPICVIPDRDP